MDNGYTGISKSMTRRVEFSVQERRSNFKLTLRSKCKLGFNGFVAMDRSLATVALEDLESSNGNQQEYWLLAVRAARVAATLAREQVATGDTVPD